MADMRKVMTDKSYSEMLKYSTFEERFKYLKLEGVVGKETFGYDRYLNQILYTSPEWIRFRREVIIRDDGKDLGVDGYEVRGRIIIHHINPITVKDIVNRNPKVFSLENTITTSHRTHQAIHYGNEGLLNTTPIERKPNDTIPWTKGWKEEQ